MTMTKPAGVGLQLIGATLLLLGLPAAIPPFGADWWWAPLGLALLLLGRRPAIRRAPS